MRMSNTAMHMTTYLGATTTNCKCYCAESVQPRRPREHLHLQQQGQEQQEGAVVVANWQQQRQQGQAQQLVVTVVVTNLQQQHWQGHRLNVQLLASDAARVGTWVGAGMEGGTAMNCQNRPQQWDAVGLQRQELHRGTGLPWLSWEEGAWLWAHEASLRGCSKKWQARVHTHHIAAAALPVNRRTGARCR